MKFYDALGFIVTLPLFAFKQIAKLAEYQLSVCPAAHAFMPVGVILLKILRT